MATFTRSFGFVRSAARLRSTGRIMLREEVENAPGQNLPFQVKNKPRLLATMLIFLGGAFSLPFIGVRFQMSKNAT